MLLLHFHYLYPPFWNAEVVFYIVFSYGIALQKLFKFLKKIKVYILKQVINYHTTKFHSVHIFLCDAGTKKASKSDSQKFFQVVNLASLEHEMNGYHKEF